MRDLLARLDRLPDGHPSSPYEDGGLVRPRPHRLRQLELGLPPPDREPAGISSFADTATTATTRPDPGAEHGSVQPPAAGHVPDGGPDADPGAAGPDEPGPAQDRSAIDRPALDRPALDRPAEASVRNGDGGRSPAASSWQDPYAARESANGHGDSGYRGQRDKELELRPWQGPAAAAGPRSPVGPAPDVGAGSGRTAATASPVTEDLAKLVADLLAAFRAAEGMTMFGDYGESGLTPVIRRIAAQLPRGGLAPGSEPDALKSAERLGAKLARLVARHPGRSPDELAAGIGDGLRYAFSFDPDYYAEGTWLVHRKLKGQGFELEARRNRWDSPEYKGVWTRWRDPAHGIAFEVQFHTGASWDVVRRTHAGYVQITDPATGPAERARLRARQVAAAAAAKAPSNCAEISDFGRDAP